MTKVGGDGAGRLIDDSAAKPRPAIALPPGIETGSPSLGDVQISLLPVGERDCRRAGGLVLDDPEVRREHPRSELACGLVEPGPQVVRTAGVVRWIGCVDGSRVGHLVPVEGRGPLCSGPDPDERLVCSDVNLARAGDQPVGGVPLPSQPPRGADTRMTGKGQFDRRGEDLYPPDIWIIDEDRLRISNSPRDLLSLIG